MQTDLFGNRRQKVNLHMHTTRSDGAHSPTTALRIYRNEGYDAVALTDHWRFGEGGIDEGMTVLSGAEYNLAGDTGKGGVFHILSIGAEREPEIVGDDDTADPQQVIDAIHAAGGLAILAHPAWSLNTPEQILRLHGFDATEIYNSVSGVHESRRPDSSIIVDQLGARGLFLPLVADDDTHYYDYGQSGRRVARKPASCHPPRRFLCHRRTGGSSPRGRKRGDYHLLALPRGCGLFGRSVG